MGETIDEFLTLEGELNGLEERFSAAENTLIKMHPTIKQAFDKVIAEDRNRTRENLKIKLDAHALNETVNQLQERVVQSEILTELHTGVSRKSKERETQLVQELTKIREQYDQELIKKNKEIENIQRDLLQYQSSSPAEKNDQTKVTDSI